MGIEDEDFDPDRFTSEDCEEAFRQGVRLFDRGEYYAAHESFERCWLANEAGDSDFFKGLIQAAICLHHFRRDNLEGARLLYSGHRRFLGAYLPAHRGVDVAAFLEQMRRALAPALRARGEGTPRPRLEDPPRIVLTAR